MPELNTETLKQKLSEFLWSRSYPYPPGAEDDEVWRKAALAVMEKMGFEYREGLKMGRYEVAFVLVKEISFKAVDALRTRAVARAIEEVRKAVESEGVFKT